MQPHTPRPPAGALRFLRCICPSSLLEGIEGDLCEAFDLDVQALGVKRATRRFWWNTLRFVRPGILLRNRLSLNLIQTAMIRNYFKVAVRSLGRNVSYTIINVGGLALALTIAIALFMIVRFERGFDAHHRHADRVYQVMSTDKYGGTSSHVPQGAITALRGYTGVEAAASIYKWTTPGVIRTSDGQLTQQTGYFLHPVLLDMIDVTWVEGSPATSLSRPYQVVLDEPTARRLFKDQDPLGQMIRYDNVLELTVSGIIKKVHPQSQFRFGMIMSYETLTKYMTYLGDENYWDGGDSEFQGFVMLREGSTPGAAERMLKDALLALEGKTLYVSFTLTPLTEMHFDMETDPFHYVVPEWTLTTLTAVGWTLILLASINFINMATAQAVVRSKEIGVRKTMGSTRWGVALQFLTETFVVVLAAMALAGAGSTMLIRYAPLIFNTTITSNAAWDAGTLWSLIITAFVVTVLAGFYPALVMSGIRPAIMLRGQAGQPGGRGITLRKVLIVTQFTIAQVMIICMIIGGRQMDFFATADLGFDKSDVITVSMPFPDSVILQERFRHVLQQQPAIRQVSFALTSPSSDYNWWWGDVHFAALPDGEAQFRLQWIDDAYLALYRIPLIAGRNLVDGDTAQIALINETAARDLGFRDPAQAVGASITYWRNNRVTVVGVVKDYHSQGLKLETPPHLYLPGRWNFREAQIRIDGTKTSSAIAAIRHEWVKLHPDHYFDYAFLSDTLDKFYTDDKRLGRAITLFSVLGIAIGCLGLFALVSYVCARRSKEVSIRKVLGASVSSLMRLLSREFLVLMSVAFLLAAPIGWYIMRRYLDQYPNRIAIDWTVFLWAGIATMLLAMITVAIRSYTTATADPVVYLKQE